MRPLAAAAAAPAHPCYPAYGRNAASGARRRCRWPACS